MAATAVESPSSKLEGDKSSETSGGSTPSLDTPGESPRKVTGHGGKEVKDGTLRRLNIKMSFRTLAQKKLDKPSDKNEPSRFLGEGVSFKAKLIGILEVSEARGDRMCQEALADLKMAIRAAGEHKQRISINIAIDGLRLRDEKNGDCLYHHPVHKISFIAQDMSDSRAFGYIFGSPDTGHRFFGIKTDKAASQVVIAMRDLFQVVFELKKKEIEMAKQHIELHQIKISGGMFPDGGSSSKNGVGSISQVTSKVRSIMEDPVRENGNASSTQSTHKTSEVIADLLDLEFELNSIQQGIHQMERITPSDPFGPSSHKDSTNNDPFGDSFAPTATLPPPPKTVRQPVTILPPPAIVKEPSPRPADPFNVPPPSRQPQRRGGVRGRNAAAERFNEAVNKPQPEPVQEKHWFDQETESLFSEGELVSPPFVTSNTAKFSNLADLVGPDMLRISPTQQNSQFDVFTDLDPLGTGRSKPYIDRKDFFQDLKNPPKKVLKDLVTEAPSEATAPMFQATFDAGSNRSSGASDVLETNISNTTVTDVPIFPPVDTDPFDEADPFYRTDPFVNADSSKIPAFPTSGSNSDPFDTGFADFTMFGRRRGHLTTGNSQESTKRTSPQPQAEDSPSVFSPRTNFHGPLRVSLPPEKSGANPEDGSPPYPSSRQSGRSNSNIAKPRNKSRLHKQTTLSGLPKLPSPKSSQRSTRLSKQMTVDGCTSKSYLSAPVTPPTLQRYDRRSPHLESVTLRSRVTPSPPVVGCFPEMDSRLSSSSVELSEIAPEPPPRPTANITMIKPPPLPPKRQQAINFVLPPRPISRSPSTDTPIYYYIGKDGMSSSPTVHDGDEATSPPIPVPARRPRFGGDDAGVAPERPRRHHPVVATLSNKSEDDYLTPISFSLLPPPQRKAQVDPPSGPAVPTTLANLIPSDTEPMSGHVASTSLNLTLSQLTKTGFADLATALRMSPGQLSNMTLQELTLCLAKLSSPAQDNVETLEESNKEKEAIRREKYSTLRESVDEEPMFRAEFENNFGDEDTFEKPPEDVFQETLFDKYAVFRELISEEKTEEQQDMSEEAVSFEETIPIEEPPVIEATNDESGDRYAALRDISLEDDADVISDHEDSIKDDEDMLRQRSESTESPTMETATMREPQSIIETTIYEEDTLEADNDDALEEVPDIMEDVEEEEEFKSPSAMGSRESLNHEQTTPEPLNIISPEPEKEEVDVTSRDITRDEDAVVSLGESWAKFDTSAFPPTKPVSEEQSEEVSPWSSDSKDFGKVQSPAWQQSFDPEDSNRRGRMSRRSPWQEEEGEEGGRERRPVEGVWRENGWSDGESFYDDVPSRKERVYHEDRRGRRRRVSPWKGQRSSRDVSPWERGRYPDDDEEDEEYEAYWKTRPKHRGSSWDDEQRRRFEPRDNGLEYEDGRKRRLSPWSGEADRRSSRESVNWEEEDRYSQRREEEYRRRREQESYSWEYGRHSGRRYYRDRSRESPWEDEYSEQGDDDSPQYPSSKRGWAKRPSSGPERRPSDKSPGEFAVKARYREKGLRPHSREGHFNSDQEYEYWPQERPRREPGYEQRSQTLHSRRPNKFKKAPDRAYSQKSPFDDDFTSHPLSISSSDIMKSGEAEVADSLPKKKSPINPAALFTYTDAFPRRRDPYLEDIRPNEIVPSSPMDPQDSPLEDSGRRAWRNRQSPFEDDFTPPNSGRRISSVSSDVSDQRRSPYDDVRPGRRVPSVAEEKEVDVDKNGRMSDDVFLPCEGGVDPSFADFENGSFVSRDPSSGRTVAECCRRSERRNLRDEVNRREKNLPKTRMPGLKVDPLNIKKSESVNIFTREKDPFDDDEFFNSETVPSSTQTRAQNSRGAEKTNNNNGDPFKWTKAFDSFNFEDEK